MSSYTSLTMTKSKKGKKGNQRKKSPSLSVGRGEKNKKGGLTAKGRKKYNRMTGSHLKAPAKTGDRHDKFCARSRSWKGPRGRQARKNWGC
tara:strand:- start:553 stop:825 length:273 start_codon:yes stop_codon:yes gene_type:complete